ncbi:MAG TPA: hypothetical protein VNG51_01090 [Ktedonobacteraceae bacterium]|nr:hypothetical protein [Ktedonobacteraceae bacterium]
MTTTPNAELEQAWKERCRTGNLSKAILGLGTIRVLGKSGDAALQFPRISSLASLGELEPDEQYAVQVAQRVIEQAREQQRSVFSGNPGETPQRVTTFDPAAESLTIVARVAGG